MILDDDRKNILRLTRTPTASPAQPRRLCGVRRTWSKKDWPTKFLDSAYEKVGNGTVEMPPGRNTQSIPNEVIRGSLGRDPCSAGKQITAEHVMA
jgi:hypothetical protein